MKILAASDTHGDTKTMKRLANKALKEQVDLVVLCGDIFGFEETNDIIKPFKDKNQEVIMIPGNWESLATTDFVANLYGMKNLHGYSVVHDKIGIFGAGGAQGPGPGRSSEKEILEALKKAHSGLEGIEKKIMITHEHPQGSKSEFSGIPGNSAITKAIKKFQPNLLLHGHIHEAAGMEEQIGNTRVINVGKQGQIIEI